MCHVDINYNAADNPEPNGARRETGALLADIYIYTHTYAYLYIYISLYIYICTYKGANRLCNAGIL